MMQNVPKGNYASLVFAKRLIAVQSKIVALACSAKLISALLVSMIMNVEREISASMVNA